ncbi:unnamed protein product [Oreochromis niloticus]|nr:unnamed protein product [Mustela putorius furo]
MTVFLLKKSRFGSFVVNVTQTCYQAENSHKITLEWTFTTNPDRSTKSLNILCELFISDKLSVLFHVHEGVEVSESQDEKFSGRVQSDKDALREGRIRLQLSRLRTDDSGLYLCEVDTGYGFTSASYKFCITNCFDEVQTGLCCWISTGIISSSPDDTQPYVEYLRETANNSSRTPSGG